MSTLNVRLGKPRITTIIVVSRVRKSISTFTTRAHEVVALAVFLWLNRLSRNDHSTVSASPHGILLAVKDHHSAAKWQEICP